MSDYLQPLSESERQEFDQLRIKLFADTTAAEYLRYLELAQRKDVPQEPKL